MSETQKEDRREVTIGVVFATYNDVVPSLVPGGPPRPVARSANRGQTVSIPASEAARLEALGALTTPADAQAIIDRALNPADNQPEGGGPGAPGEPLTVSPPSLGAEPTGDLTKGDTGGADVQPVSVAPGEEASGPTFDGRGADIDQAEAWLRSERPTAPQVVDAAHDDPEAAQTLLEAEQLVTNGDPRKTVEAGLQNIIDGSGS